MIRALRVALLCGALPLLVGVSIFVLWLLTRWDGLVMAGFITLYAGVVVFVVGAGALGRFCWLGFRGTEWPRRRLWLATLGGAALLLSNFAAAGGVIAAVVAVETRYTLTVRNSAAQPLTGVRVSGGGCDVDLGEIPPGAVVRRSLWIKQNGVLEFRAMSGVQVHTQTISDYVTDGMGGRATVTFQPDATIAVDVSNVRD